MVTIIIFSIVLTLTIVLLLSLPTDTGWDGVGGGSVGHLCR